MNSRRSRGLTLLELLLAMSAGLVVLLVAAHALGNAGANCGRAGGATGVRREFRFVTEQWAADFSNAVSALGAEVSSADSNGWSDRVGFYLLQPPSKQQGEESVGDLCAVSYYLKDLESRGQVVRCLMRGVRSSAETFEAIRTDTRDTLFKPREGDEPVAFGVARFNVRRLNSAGVKSVSRSFEWQLEIARRELAAQLVDSPAWDALAYRRPPSWERQVEARAGIVTVGHEATH
jgi:hypothetical protein